MVSVQTPFIGMAQGCPSKNRTTPELEASTVEENMKLIASTLLVLGLLAVQVSEANAVVCARGVYRAGCVGPHGAVGVHRPYGYGGAAVVRRPYGAAVVRPYGVHRRVVY
jgi:hypothetical protein